MASESADDGAVTVDLSGDLDEWLDQRAATLGVSRGELVQQLLSAYRATAEMEDSEAAELLEVEPVVEAAVESHISAEGVDDAVAAAVRERLPEITEAVENQLDDRFESVEAEFHAKLDDVRERVVQLKRETDAKAPAEHDHAAFERLDDLEGELATVRRELASVREERADRTEDLRAEVDDVADDVDDIDERLADAEDKLKRVAWVVSDLRDDQGNRDAHQAAVDRIKRAAAQENITAADCESCGEQVEVGLLTEPQCPHCSATVSDVRPDGGIFRKKARLVTAAQLEAGENE